MNNTHKPFKDWTMKEAKDYCNLQIETYGNCTKTCNNCMLSEHCGTPFGCLEIVNYIEFTEEERRDIQTLKRLFLDLIALKRTTNTQGILLIRMLHPDVLIEDKMFPSIGNNVIVSVKNENFGEVRYI